MKASIDEKREAHEHRNRRAAALHTLISAATAELLDIVAEVDEEQSFFCDGSAGLADWLAGTLCLTRKTALTWIRVARRLDDFPSFRAAMAAGTLGLDQVLALMKYIDPGDADDQLVAEAIHIPAEELEQVARSMRPIRAATAREDRRHRHHHGWFSEDDRFYLYKGRLPAEDGIILETAVERLAIQSPRHETCGLFRPHHERAADAIVQMASEALARDGSPDRATVVVHIDDATMAADAEGTATLEFGPAIPAAAARRMACDGRIQLVAHVADGTPIGVGRATRKIPYWLERLVRRRDGGCRFPACGRTRWTHSHHIRFWTRDNGPTDLGNLVTLCGYHHRMLHDAGWSVEGDPAGHLTWRIPTGDRYIPPKDPFGSLEFDEIVAMSLGSMGTFGTRLVELRANAPP